jgi:hypothetical protein
MSLDLRVKSAHNLMRASALLPARKLRRVIGIGLTIAAARKAAAGAAD